jgi:hypothetical protein
MIGGVRTPSQFAQRARCREAGVHPDRPVAAPAGERLDHRGVASVLHRGEEHVTATEGTTYLLDRPAIGGAFRIWTGADTDDMAVFSRVVEGRTYDPVNGHYDDLSEGTAWQRLRRRSSVGV